MIKILENYFEYYTVYVIDIDSETHIREPYLNCERINEQYNNLREDTIS